MECYATKRMQENMVRMWGCWAKGFTSFSKSVWRVCVGVCEFVHLISQRRFKLRWDIIICSCWGSVEGCSYLCWPGGHSWSWFPADERRQETNRRVQWHRVPSNLLWQLSEMFQHLLIDGAQNDNTRVSLFKALAAEQLVVTLQVSFGSVAHKLVDSGD